MSNFGIRAIQTGGANLPHRLGFATPRTGTDKLLVVQNDSTGTDEELVVTVGGKVTVGEWNATTIGHAYGGTGLSTLGTALQVLRVNSGGTALEFASLIATGHSVYLATAVSRTGAGGWVTVPMDTTRQGSGLFDLTTDEVTIPAGETGWYALTGAISTSGTSGIRFLVNGATVFSEGTGTRLVYLAAGDKVVMQTQEQSGGTVTYNAGANTTYFEIVRL